MALLNVIIKYDNFIKFRNLSKIINIFIKYLEFKNYLLHISIDTFIIF